MAACFSGGPCGAPACGPSSSAPSSSVRAGARSSFAPSSLRGWRLACRLLARGRCDARCLRAVFLRAGLRAVFLRAVVFRRLACRLLTRCLLARRSSCDAAGLRAAFLARRLARGLLACRRLPCGLARGLLARRRLPCRLSARSSRAAVLRAGLRASSFVPSSCAPFSCAPICEPLETSTPPRVGDERVFISYVGCQRKRKMRMFRTDHGWFSSRTAGASSLKKREARSISSSAMRSSGACINGAVSNRDIVRCGKNPYATHSGKGLSKPMTVGKTGQNEGHHPRLVIDFPHEIPQKSSQDRFRRRTVADHLLAELDSSTRFRIPIRAAP